MNTSAHSMSRSSDARPSGLRRSIATPRLLRLNCSNRKLKSPVSATKPIAMIWRSGSPVGRSTFTTFAPHSARIAAADGTKPCSATSSTLTPSITPIAVSSGSETSSAAERGDRRSRALVERSLHHDLDERADVLETVAHGLAHQEARVDAFENDRELVRRERFVEVELAHVAARLLRVPLDDIVTRQESGLGRDRRADVPGLRVVAHVVEHVQAEIREGIAERGHLPVEHRDDASRIVGREHRVVEAVVAVDDGRGRRRWERGAQPARELVDRGKLAGLRPLPLLAPAPHLPFDVAFGMAEVAEPHGLVVDGMDRGEYLDEFLGTAPGLALGQRRDLGARAQDLPVDELHDVERRVVDRDVVTER